MVTEFTLFLQDYQSFWVPVGELISAQQSGLAKMTYQASSIQTFFRKMLLFRKFIALYSAP